MKTLGQPGRKARLRRGQIHTGHADLGKSELTGPLPDFRNQLRTVDLSAVERHLPIVETATWTSEEDTHALAARLAGHPSIANAFIELRGELGAGKTTFVRHLLQALGVQGRIKSPTYAVVEPYELERLNIWHFDFYRFNDPREWEDAGFRDIFSSPGLKLAEWPDKAAGLLPAADLVLHIEMQADETRQVSLQAQTATGRELLA
ncbi:MAG: tRNA (adenosine(37)-N6)-threonylcarbamoyltransferase complex ATPase subunit type 1 TsaE [Comamonadaceae bacterium]|nr:MAG: tRNA (adenosine(37)-N6)-threonylcarbamoyltransferase complex ATPase subunit type 1 TsaE [Comamonadaceae bacterium]